MQIKSEPFEEKVVIDVSARYDNSSVEFTLQPGDTFGEQTEFFYAEFKNPNELKSDIRIYKQGLRAISTHQRKQRYRVDLPEAIASQESASPGYSTPQALTSTEPSSSRDQEPQA